MKKALGIVAALALFAVIPGVAFADGGDGMGPAPGYGDGIPNEDCLQYGPNEPGGEVGSGAGPIGPAPNSGDGIPDGSGF